MHKKKVYDGTRYPCNLCNYSSLRIGHVRALKEAVQMGNKHDCHVCELKVSTKGNLKSQRRPSTMRKSFLVISVIIKQLHSMD